MTYKNTSFCRIRHFAVSSFCITIFVIRLAKKIQKEHFCAWIFIHWLTKTHTRSSVDLLTSRFLQAFRDKLESFEINETLEDSNFTVFNDSFLLCKSVTYASKNCWRHQSFLFTLPKRNSSNVKPSLHYFIINFISSTFSEFRKITSQIFRSTLIINDCTCIN